MSVSPLIRKNLSDLQALLSAGLQNFVDLSSLISVPNSTIVGRAQIPNIAADLKASMGIDRVCFQQLAQLQSEFGSNGEAVYATPNDSLGLVRFIGPWSGPGAGGSFGSFLAPGLANTSALEITFFGTGLNLLIEGYSSSESISVTVDGGSTNTLTIPTGSTVIGGRNYAPNEPFNVVSGLTLGIHTVKMLWTTINLNYYGYEVFNSSSSVTVNPGTAYLSGQKVSPALQALSYNASATGITGGRVLNYLTSAGIFSQAFTACAVGSTLLPSTHTNEEVARVYAPNEFGAGRSANDDWSQVSTGSAARAFTLDDGTTTLVGYTSTSSSAYLTSLSGKPIGASIGAVGVAATGAILLTFVGTGLDLYLYDSAAGGSDQNTFQIDGGAVTNMPYSAGNTTPRMIKIVSGLPYGTHTFQFNKVSTASTFLPIFINFTVYQPKKPTLPAGALELSDYNVMANYAFNSAGTTAPSAGTLRKNCIRELFYVGGGWGVNGIGGGPASGLTVSTSTAAAYVEYTFFGTGIEHKFFVGSGNTVNWTYSIDGTTNLSGAGYTATVANAGTGLSIVSTTGVLSGTQSANEYGTTVAITGLPLGLHKLRITYNSGTSPLYIDVLDIVTPIYSVRPSPIENLQNTLSIGSCAISDSRQTTPVRTASSSTKAWAQAVGITSGPTTTSTSFVPAPDMSLTIKTSGSPLDISYAVTNYNSTSGAQVLFQVYVDGVAVGTPQSQNQTGNEALVTSDRVIVPVSAGVHKVDLYWKITTNTGNLNSTQRDLLAKEF